MRPLVLALPGGEAWGEALARLLPAEPVAAVVRRFPDGETYVRIDAEVGGRDVLVVGSLDQPDAKIVQVVLVADTLRDLGARRSVLVAPYLAYLRQDRRFRPGEGVTSASVAALLSRHVDGLVTVDPHLHRWHALDEIYSVPSRVVAAAPAVAAWIRGNVREPVLVGPDAESAQWVHAVAEAAAAPAIVLDKVRRGDRDVEVSVPDVHRWREATPVLVDDIVSTGTTLAETTRHLRRAGLGGPTCIAVHALFVGDAERSLRAAGAERVVSCNTVAHPTNAIDLAPLVAEAARAPWDAGGGGR